jgi:hypothetical protein
MDVSVEFKWNPKTKSGLQRIPDEILYTCAKQTLDLSLSQSLIPKSNTVGHAGTLRTATMSYGVHQSPGDMTIGSPTGYASYVWVMPESTNWTTPGTNNKWFARTLKRYSSTILNNAVNQSWKKVM